MIALNLDNLAKQNNSSDSEKNPEILYPVPDGDLVQTLKGINRNVNAWKSGVPAAQSLGYAVRDALAIDEFFAYLEDNEVKYGTSTAAEGEAIISHLFYYYLTRDRLAEAALICWGPDIFSPLAWTTRVVWGALAEHHQVNVMGCSSAGKCLGPDEPVLMFDGSIKKAKDVRVGDQLMGDDSKPRNVLVANPGYGKLYRIVPDRGRSWVCNDAHILSLRCNYNRMNGNGSINSKYYKGNVIDIEIKDYIKSSKNVKNILKQFSVGVEFAQQEVEFDPYIYGAWLGDGGTTTPSLHTPACAMSDRWSDYFISKGYRIKGITKSQIEEGKCPAFFARYKENGGVPIQNPFTAFIRSSVNELGEKIIRKEYMINSKAARMQLLAGLIDSDGTCDKNHSGFTVTTKYKHLAEQISWVARSLGFTGYVSENTKTIKSIGFKGTYYNVTINGEGVTEIPTLMKKTKEPVRNPTNVGFKIEEAGEGEYYGFVIDGNHRFLLGDFTVTHNTYSAAAYFLLQYVADPEWTNILLVAQKFETLKKVLFADMVRLFQGSIVKFPGEVESEAIAVNKTTGMGIRCEAVRAGSGNGSIKGRKRKPRPEHPKYGKLSRLFIIADEAQEIPVSFFEIIVNLVSGIDGDEDIRTLQGGKILMAANPSDRFSQYGINCEPVSGWDTLDMSADAWDSMTGWRIVRLNGLKTENVKAKKVIFPGQFSYTTYLRNLQSVAGNTDHPKMWTYVYGMFPPNGENGTLISPENVADSNKFWNFMGNTNRFAALDPAYVGDDAAFSWGTSGKAISYQDLRGMEHKLEKPKYCLQIENVVSLPKGDTHKLARAAMEKLAQLGITDPNHFGIDISGNTGTRDIIEVEWNQRVRKLHPTHPDYNKRVTIRSLHFQARPTENLILSEDISSPYELYKDLAGEMWFATSKWFSVGCIGLNRDVDLRARSELTARKGVVSSKAKRSRVESKDEYKSRGNKSPDYADSCVMLVQTCRLTVSWKPGWIEEKVTEAPKDPLSPMKWEIKSGFGFSGAPKSFNFSSEN